MNKRAISKIIFILVAGIVLLSILGFAAVKPQKTVFNKDVGLIESSLVTSPIKGELLLASKPINIVPDKPNFDNVDPSILQAYKTFQDARNKTQLVSFNATSNELISISPESQKETILTNGQVNIDEDNKRIEYQTPEGITQTKTFEDNLQYVALENIELYQAQNSQTFENILSQSATIALELGVANDTAIYVTQPYFGIGFQNEKYIVTAYYDNYELIGYNIALTGSNTEDSISNLFESIPLPEFMEASITSVECSLASCEVVMEADNSIAIQSSVELYQETSITNIFSAILLSDFNEENLNLFTKKFIDYRFDILGEQILQDSTTCETGWRTSKTECTYNGITCGQFDDSGLRCWHA